MQIRNHTLVVALATFVLPFLVVGCSGDDDSDGNAPDDAVSPVLTRVVEGQTTPVLEPAGGATATREPQSEPTATNEPAPSVPTNDQPPPTTASSGGASVEMGIGTYCWGTLCVDKIGPVTRGTLTIASGDEVVVAIPAGTPALNSVNVTVFAATQPLALEGGETAWSLPPIDGVTLAFDREGAEVRIDATLEPGTYVLTVGMFFEAGDVQYGVVLDVR